METLITTGSDFGEQAKIAELLAAGETTSEAADRLGVSAGRVSQFRRGLYAAWRQFHDEAGFAAA